MNLETVGAYSLFSLLAADVIINIIRIVKNGENRAQLEEKIHELKLQIEKIEHHSKSKE